MWLYQVVDMFLNVAYLTIIRSIDISVHFYFYKYDQQWPTLYTRKIPAVTVVENFVNTPINSFSEA